MPSIRLRTAVTVAESSRRPCAVTIAVSVSPRGETRCTQRCAVASWCGASPATEPGPRRTTTPLATADAPGHRRRPGVPGLREDQDGHTGGTHGRNVCT